MKNKVINLQDKIVDVTMPWTPKIIEQMNDYHIKLAKFHGEFSWHTHDKTDEMFMVIKGEMKILFRDKEVHMSTGDIYVVPRGVEHKPIAEDVCHVMLIEPIGTVNTGDKVNEQTASHTDWI